MFNIQLKVVGNPFEVYNPRLVPQVPSKGDYIEVCEDSPSMPAGTYEVFAVSYVIGADLCVPVVLMRLVP